MERNGSNLLHLLATAMIVGTPHAAQGQAVDEDEDEEIVVTGTRLGTEPVRDEAIAYVRQVIGRPVDGQYSRWHEPICPKTIGLDDRHSALVVQNIKRIAAEAGAKVGKAACRPNIVVTFTTGAVGLMKTLSKKQPSPFGEVSPVDRKSLIEGNYPVRWWYTTHSEGADGHQITSSSAALLNMQDFPTPRSGKFLDSYYSTLIGSKLHVNMRTVAVVVDIDAASGSTLNALSAYIAMVALVPTKLNSDYSGLPSILALFPLKSGAARRGLSEWDQAYLSSVYKVPADRTARVQRSLIVGQMLKRLGQ